MKAILTFILLLSVCSVFGQSTVPTPLAGGTAMAVNRTYKDQFTGDRTMTFTGNASEGVTITLLMDVTTGVTITFPSSYQEGGAVTPITSLVFAAGQHFMQWRRVGSNWTLWDSTSASNAAVSDTAVAASWNGVTLIAPSKNAVHDWGIIFDTDLDGKVNVLDVGAGLTKTDSNGVVSAAAAGTDYGVPSDTAYNATSWDANTDVPTKNAVRDKIESLSVGASHTVTFAVDGAGVALTTGVKIPIKIPYGGTLSGYTMMCSPSGSITFNIFRAADGAGLPTASIINNAGGGGGSGTLPAISAGVEGKSTTFTNWGSTTLTAFDNLALNLTTVDGTVTKCTLVLYYQ